MADLDVALIAFADVVAGLRIDHRYMSTPTISFGATSTVRVRQSLM